MLVGAVPIRVQISGWMYLNTQFLLKCEVKISKYQELERACLSSNQQEKSLSAIHLYFIWVPQFKLGFGFWGGGDILCLSN